jgi:hypothetical protein
MKQTPSRSSPRNSRRGCLCKDRDTYSRECCDGTLWAQGIGAVVATPSYLVTQSGIGRLYNQAVTAPLISQKSVVV